MSSKTFRVTWYIDVEADSYETAARQAWKHMRAPDSTANDFTVAPMENLDAWERVDLQVLDDTPTELNFARKLVAEILSRGYSIRVWEGGGWAGERSTDLEEIVQSLNSTGEDTLKIKVGDTYAGTILLVWGNNPDGSELISDYSVGSAIGHVIDKVQSEWDALIEEGE